MAAKVEVSFANSATARGYSIHIGGGTLATLGARLAAECPAHRYIVIADSRVAGLYGQQVIDACGDVPVDLLAFPEGEAHKNREQWADLSDRMLVAGVGRDAAVLALGGGVTGDLAGFVAATYLRGLPLVQLPTSLLAMIDSSVGGKTGVDTDAGKNLIGAFHQPTFVLADVSLLRTLAPEHLRSGLAEAIKHGAISDADYFDWIAERTREILGLDDEAVTRLVERSVAIKAAVVSADEREGGLRKTLNFGHTLGHAIEAASDFGLLHGEAIAIGMIAEARLGEALGVTATGTAYRLTELIDAAGLPTSIPAELDPGRILELTRVDKKARGGQVEYALIERVGAASRGTGSWGQPVDDEAVAEAIEASR